MLILIAALVRCLIAGSINLGNDEVYYRMYAQYLQWNYFDHPPAVGWLIRISTFNLYFDNELFIRLGAIVSAAITTWFIFLSGQKLHNAYTGFLAAVIYTASIYGNIIAGTFILPDSPQMACWSAGMYLLIDLARDNHINQTKKANLLLFGIVAGLGMLCKIHTSFLWFGLLLYLVLYNRNWLKEPALYTSGLITLLLFFPVIKWNIENHFVTYLYHSERVDVSSGGFDPGALAGFIGGQVLYTNPIIFYFIILSVIAAFKNKLPVLTPQKRLLLCCSLPLIIVAACIAFFKPVLPHWSGPAYYGLMLFTALYFSSRKTSSTFANKIIPKPLLAACALHLIVIAAGILMIRFMPGTLGKKGGSTLGDGDFTLDMYGWHTVKDNFKTLLKNDQVAGVMKTDAVIVSNKWFPAAHIDFYLAMPLNIDLVAIGDTNDIHQYIWINKERRKLKSGDDCYCIVPSNNFIDVNAVYQPYFKTILPPEIVEQKRNGKTCRLFYIWRMKGFIPN